MVEGGSLENCYAGNGIVSSNLTPTALLLGLVMPEADSSLVEKAVFIVRVTFFDDFLK